MHESSEKGRIKPLRERISHPLEWLQLKRLKIPSTGEDVEQYEPSHTTCESSK